MSTRATNTLAVAEVSKYRSGGLEITLDPRCPPAWLIARGPIDSTTTGLLGAVLEAAVVS